MICFTTPYQGMRAVQRWRLMFPLLLATIVHILVIALPLPSVIPLARSPTPALEVRLAPAIQTQQNTRALLSKEALGSATTNAHPARKAQQVSPKPQSTNRFDAPNNMAPPPVTVERPAAAASPPPPISIESLLDSTKSVVRDEARRMRPSKDETTDLDDRAALPALAKALKKQNAGETRFTDGLIRVVTPSGAVYCLRPLPDLVAHDGPVKPTIVPTNCP